MNLSESVILPREDFIELQVAASQSVPVPTSERIATTIQTTVVCVLLSGAFAGGAWAYYKAANWYEEKSAKRQKDSHYQFKTRTHM